MLLLYFSILLYLSNFYQTESEKSEKDALYAFLSKETILV